MIGLAEIKRVAAGAGVDVATIEKDYVLSWVLKGLFESTLCDALVFKGGTALRKIYFDNYRFSEDLDFTISNPLELDAINSSLIKTCQKLSNESGLELAVANLKQTNMAAGQEAFEGKIEYIGPRQHRGNPARIKLDLTAYEELILPPTELPLIHGYSDPCSTQITTYQLEEILAEKFRTIIQRGYPRDLYDTWFILTLHQDKVDLDLVRRTYLRKCAFKNVRPVDWREFFESPSLLNKDAAFVNSLGKQLKDLPTYSELITDLAKILTDLGMSQEPLV